MDVLAGRPVQPDRFSFILAGSKRLLTPVGAYGDNSDVIGPPPPSCGGGASIGWAGAWAGPRSAPEPELQHVELRLDSAIFDDGLCVGPDEKGLFESVTSELAVQRETAEQMAAALRAGAARGEIFDRLRPLAQHPHLMDHRGARHVFGLRSTFGQMAIHHLVHMQDADLLAWFDSFITPGPMKLHRA